MAIGSMRTSHALHEGHALCGFNNSSVPKEWPTGHVWVNVEQIKQISCRPCHEQATIFIKQRATQSATALRA